MARKRGPTWQPGAEDYSLVLREQNPWQQTQDVPAILARMVERPMAQMLWKRLEHDSPRRFQLVLGPRRVGKSTCLYQTVQRLLRSGVPVTRLWWLRLDHPLLMEIDLGSLVRTVLKSAKATNESPLYLFLDELAYAQKWDLWLKTFYDENWPIRLAGSSSSTAVLRERLVESGIGRWEEQYLAPYLFREFLDLKGKHIEISTGDSLAQTLDACIEAKIDLSGLADLRKVFLLTGGFPELLLAVSVTERSDDATLLLQSQRTLRNDAIERAIYKDIPQAFGVDNPMMLERLLYTLAGQVTGVLSPSGICQSLGLSQPTFDRYVAYLTQSFLIFALPNYSGREISRQRRGRKLYFIDGAARNAALQRGIAPLSNAEEMGILLENLVAGHLHALSERSQVRLYHWRDGADEVDLVYDHPEHPIALEVASSARHKRSGLVAFAERFPQFRGRCYLVAPDASVILAAESMDGIGTLPLDLLLLAISSQAELELSKRLVPSG